MFCKLEIDLSVCDACSVENESVTINARKFDFSIHRTWKCNLIEETANYWLFVGKFQTEVKHSKLGIIKAGTISYEYYFKDKWFNIFRFHEPNGELRNYYCNINQPPKFENNTLNFVDLDIDVLVWADFNVEILDLEEFEQNREKFGYSTELISKTLETLDEVLEIVRLKQFPFDNLAKPLNLSKI